MLIASKIKNTFFKTKSSSKFSVYQLANIFHIYNIAKEKEKNIYFNLKDYSEFKNTLVSLGRINWDDKDLALIRKEFHYDFEIRLSDEVNFLEIDLDRKVIFGLERLGQIESHSVKINPYIYLPPPPIKYLL
jgi:hypothetical protein